MSARSIINITNDLWVHPIILLAHLSAIFIKIFLPFSKSHISKPWNKSESPCGALCIAMQVWIVKTKIHRYGINLVQLSNHHTHFKNIGMRFSAKFSTLNQNLSSHILMTRGLYNIQVTSYYTPLAMTKPELLLI